MPINSGFWPGSRLDRLMKIPGPAKPAQSTAPAVTLSLNGIASGVAFGNTSPAVGIQVVGITSGARVGNQTVAASFAALGIASGSRVGNESVAAVLAGTGIPSGARMGNETVAASLAALGIPSGARVGNRVVAPVLTTLGVPSGVKIGNTTLAALLKALGISSGTQVGNINVGAPPVNLSLNGIPSGATFGVEIISASIGLVGIPSGAVVGSETTSLTIQPPGIPSGAVAGIPSIMAQAVPSPVPAPTPTVPPPLADAIYQYVEAVLESTFDVPTVIWEFEGGPRPNVFPYLSLNIVRSHGVGQAYQSSIAADVGAQGVFRPKDWTVRINGWGGGSRDLVEAVRQSLEAPWWIDTLEGLGLSYRDMTQPRATSRIIDFSSEQAWSMDITFGASAELAQSIAAWIEFAIISGTIVAPDGSKQVLPVQTVGK